MGGGEGGGGGGRGKVSGAPVLNHCISFSFTSFFLITHEGVNTLKCIYEKTSLKQIT